MWAFFLYDILLTPMRDVSDISDHGNLLPCFTWKADSWLEQLVRNIILELQLVALLPNPQVRYRLNRNTGPFLTNQKRSDFIWFKWKKKLEQLFLSKRKIWHVNFKKKKKPIQIMFYLWLVTIVNLFWNLKLS